MKRKAKSTREADKRNGCVCFELTHPTAQAVAIAGSFNDWHPSVTPLIALGEGHWRKELTLPPGRYEYRLVVDGQWVDDPEAKETVSNPFGGFNAVVTVENH
jgi:1,4-alpha-glucan branching enzyme